MLQSVGLCVKYFRINHAKVITFSIHAGDTTIPTDLLLRICVTLTFDLSTLSAATFHKSCDQLLHQFRETYDYLLSSYDDLHLTVST